MNLNLRKPLAFFDLETTGINISKDRIVEISIVKVHINGTKEIKTERINPGMSIPKESSMIHGIYDEDVANKPKFAELAKTFANYLEGCDLAGFNIVKFDVPMLVEEFLRADVNFDIKNRNLVDAQKIFHMMEPRTLSAAYRFYCNKDLDNAHSAEADTLATFEVLNAQMQRYENKEVVDDKGNKTIPIVNDMTALHKLTISKNVDLAGRMVYNDKGDALFNFGKYKDKLVTDVLQKDPAYYGWIMDNDFALDTKRKLTELKLNMLKK
ncbi:MAG: 3'-5' exonuclease [Cytophagales bacterium]